MKIIIVLLLCTALNCGCKTQEFSTSTNSSDSQNIYSRALEEYFNTEYGSEGCIPTRCELNVEKDSVITYNIIDSFKYFNLNKLSRDSIRKLAGSHQTTGFLRIFPLEFERNKARVPIFRMYAKIDDSTGSIKEEIVDKSEVQFQVRKGRFYVDGVWTRANF